MKSCCRYLTGRTGQYVRRFDYVAGSDAATLKEGRSLLDEAPIVAAAELWEGRRFVGSWERREPRVQPLEHPLLAAVH